LPEPSRASSDPEPASYENAGNGRFGQLQSNSRLSGIGHQWPARFGLASEIIEHTFDILETIASRRRILDPFDDQRETGMRRYQFSLQGFDLGQFLAQTGLQRQSYASI